MFLAAWQRYPFFAMLVFLKCYQQHGSLLYPEDQGENGGGSNKKEDRNFLNLISKTTFNFAIFLSFEASKGCQIQPTVKERQFYKVVNNRKHGSLQAILQVADHTMVAATIKILHFLKYYVRQHSIFRWILIIKILYLNILALNKSSLNHNT